MSRLGSPALNTTFKGDTLANASGIATINGQELTVELLTADPTQTSGVPRVWINLTDKKIKFYDGTTAFASAALT